MQLSPVTKLICFYSIRVTAFQTGCSLFILELPPRSCPPWAAGLGSRQLPTILYGLGMPRAAAATLALGARARQAAGHQAQRSRGARSGQGAGLSRSQEAKLLGPS